MSFSSDTFSRSEALLGADTMNRLQSARVLLIGVGGVGSWCAEALIRTGLTHLTIMDGDLVQASNINRQLPATQSTIGCSKVEVLRERLLSINPDAEIIAIHAMYDASFSLSGYDYIIDAIDSIAAKTDLILHATRMRGVKIFCSMGAALRFDPTQVTTGELMTIKGDALAKAVRARMKRLDAKPYKKVKCVYSTENVQPLPSSPEGEVIKGSIMPVTAVFGCTLASMVIDDCRRQPRDHHGTIS